jgi:hypothetical protein
MEHAWIGYQGKRTRGIKSRTRAPSRLSGMWTALLLARLGEISIVLHVGRRRAERQEKRWVDGRQANCCDWERTGSAMAMSMVCGGWRCSEV